MIQYKWAVVSKDTEEIVRVYPFGGDVGTPLITQFKWEARMALIKIVGERPSWKGRIEVVKVNDFFRTAEASA